jgi:hypothetical protein
VRKAIIPIGLTPIDQVESETAGDIKTVCQQYSVAGLLLKLAPLFTDDDLLLEKLVGDEILGPADHTHHGASPMRFSTV